MDLFNSKRHDSCFWEFSHIYRKRRKLKYKVVIRKVKTEFLNYIENKITYLQFDQLHPKSLIIIGYLKYKVNGADTISDSV